MAKSTVKNEFLMNLFTIMGDEIFVSIHGANYMLRDIQKEPQALVMMLLVHLSHQRKCQSQRLDISHLYFLHPQTVSSAADIWLSYVW